MPSYTPTQNPGDTRTRSRQQTIMSPHNGGLVVEILEQQVVRVSPVDPNETNPNVGEVPLAGRDSVLTVSVDLAQAMTNTFPGRLYHDDSLTGETLNEAKVLNDYYSWIRWKQILRDQAEQENPEP